jgi:uncharacterized protein (DUF2132 family)
MAYLLENNDACSYQKANYLILHMQQVSKDPLHGKTLEYIVTELVNYFGWEDLGQHIPINCFNRNPSIQSSLKFLRKTPWARKKVEDLYIRMIEA